MSYETNTNYKIKSASISSQADSPIRQKLNCMEKELEVINQRAIDLQGRLMTIMTPDNPEKSVPSTDVKAPPTSPLWDELDSLITHMISIRQILQSCIERLQV